MKKAEIEKRVLSIPGVRDLNAMQRIVLDRDPTDLVLVAPTGSGKTLAFAIAMLRQLHTTGNGVLTPRALVIAPSRELVLQIAGVLKELAGDTLRTTALYGGNPFSAEQATLQSNGADIVVATPGRLNDHLNRGTLSLENLQQLVVDEYDKTLELGFEDDLRRIVRRLPRQRLNMLTSATAIAAFPDYLDLDRAPVLDFSARRHITVMTVPSAERDKLDTLAALLRGICTKTRAIVFVNHRDAAQRVADGLKARHIDAALYHGGLEQQQRRQAVAMFDADAAPVLVATDLAARGLDIENMGAVVHYHMPVDKQAYIHRNGRTGRAGAGGEAYVITGPDEDTPDFIVADHPYLPDGTAQNHVWARMAMLYINAGKRNKISRGDVAGFIIKQCGVPAEDVGRITVGDTWTLAAIKPAYATAVCECARSARLKNTRVRITPLQPWQ